MGFYFNLSRPLFQRQIADQGLLRPSAIPEESLKAQAKANPDQQYYWHDGKKYVYIENKFYEYNEKNSYTVNGVRTLYINKSSEVKSPDQVDGTLQTTVIEEVNKLLRMSPMDMYTRDGVEQLMRSLEASQKSLAERDKALNQMNR